MRDPWVILGITRVASVDEIKSAYRKLALSLHPDKHGADLTPEQRKEREDQFKEVSVAYQVALDIARARESGYDFSTSDDYEKWRGMWERVEGMIRSQNFMTVLGNALKGTLKDIAISTINRMGAAAGPPGPPHDDTDCASDISSDVDTSSYTSIDPAAEDDTSATSTSSLPAEPQRDPEPRIFKLAVGLDEVHTKQQRRVRLFLNDCPDTPFFVDIPFDSFPEVRHVHVDSGTGTEYLIVVQMTAKPHPVYYWDALLGGWDLYTTVPISLHEYIMGCKRPIPRLGGSTGTVGACEIELAVPAFPNLKKPIVFERLGLRYRGNLYVMIEVRLPTRGAWKALAKEDPEVLEAFTRVCKKLENPNAPHRCSS